MNIRLNPQLLAEVSAFLWLEADMLDHAEFSDWLDLWTEDGLYIVPIDPEESDLENTLNYAYDNGVMRQKRVARLTSGESISTQPPSRLVRSLSRFRILSDDGKIVTLRAAQNLREFRKETLRLYTSDITFEVARVEGGFKLHRKIVRLINSTDVLQGIGFIL